MEIHVMSDRKSPSLPFESSDAAEQKLWQALGDLPQAEPDANLRRSFYNELEKASSLSWGGRVRAWLGLSNNSGWVTATACLLIESFDLWHLMPFISLEKMNLPFLL